MNSKWYLSTLVVIIAFLGFYSEQQISVPNQEIVLQFTNAEVTTEEAQNTLEIVKKQLQDLGVENIQIKARDTRSLTIVYYSDANVAIIKSTLSKEKNLALDYSSIHEDEKEMPSDENSVAYNLDVHELKKGNDSDWSFNGKYVLELKPKSNRFFQPKVYASHEYIDVINNEHIVKVAYKIYTNIANAINNSSHTIPEVRAGPLC